MEPVSLSAGEDSALFLLVGAAEIEPGNIGAGAHGAATDLHVFCTA